MVAIIPTPHLQSSSSVRKQSFLSLVLVLGLKISCYLFIASSLAMPLYHCTDCRPDLIFNQSPHTKCKLSVLWIKQTTFPPFLGFPQKILSSVVFYAKASLWHSVTKFGGLHWPRGFPCCFMIGGSFHHFS